ncbi:MAG: hypothetical protein WCJ33_01520 [Pseudomonadota bacterium]
MAGFKGAYSAVGEAVSENINILPQNYNEVINGTWSLSRNGLYLPNVAFVNQTSPAVGNEFNVFVNVIGGTYTIRVSMYNDVNTCQWIMLIDGVPFGAVQDNYIASAVSTTLYTYNFVGLTKGAHKIGFRVTGKNGSSSNFFMQFTGLNLQKTS